MNKQLVVLSLLPFAISFPKAAFCDPSERDDVENRNVEHMSMLRKLAPASGN
jgi:hypothetical protein